MSEEVQAVRTETAAVKTSRFRRPRGGLGIQSKLLLMLLGVSLISALVVGLIGFTSGRESLREAATDQVTTIRTLRVGEIEQFMKNLRDNVESTSRNASIIDGSRAFVSGFNDLQSAEITPAQNESLDDFYSTQFIPAIQDRSGLGFEASSFIPASNAGKYLQSFYTVNRPLDDYDNGLVLQDAGDGSAWSAASAKYGPYLSSLVDTLGYEDLLILNPDSQVVYSAFKSVELGVSMKETNYASSALTEAVATVLRTGAVDQVIVTDFERYLPALNDPAAWVVSPIGDNGSIDGVLAIQVPASQINDVMTGNQGWEAQGLGETGEVYLAGADHTMRSTSRMLIEDPQQFEKDVIANGTPTEIAERVVREGNPVLLQPSNSTSVNNALRGKTGTSISTSYLGGENITSYSPVDIEGVQWVAVARVDTSEAFAPVTEFTRNLVLSTLGLMLLISLLSLLLAQVFTRPINRLSDAVRRVAGGDLAVTVPTTSRDEFGDLGRAFNDMASSLRTKQELIDEQQTENRKLLHTLMPETVAERYKQGEESISEQHDNVAVIYAELVGFDEYSHSLDSGEEVMQLNLLMRGFDEAAQKSGVEKVRALRGGYLASSGLIVPRLDNVRRAVDFAIQMRTVLERFNDQNGTELSLRAGVDTGTVTSGLVARTNLAYDLWGDAVSLAYQARTVSGEPGVYVSQKVRERLQDTFTFTEVGAVDLRGNTETVWRVEK